MRNLQRIIVFLFVAAAFSLFASTSEAARPKLFSRLIQYRRAIAPTYQQRYQYANWRYPKYTGAFHANYFRDMGVPPGDVGFRGNGLYATPW